MPINDWHELCFGVRLLIPHPTRRRHDVAAVKKTSKAIGSGTLNVERNQLNKISFGSTQNTKDWWPALLIPFFYTPRVVRDFPAR